MLDPSFYAGAYGRPRLPQYDNSGDAGYSGAGSYVMTPENSVHTGMHFFTGPDGSVQGGEPPPNKFVGFLSGLQQAQQRRQNGGLVGAIGAAQKGGLAGLAKFLI